jgi:23S rRNA pseudouridine2605 synthase
MSPPAVLADAGDGPMRIQRALARAGIASRRKAEALVEAGRVTVNGVVATLGQVVDPRREQLEVDGNVVGAPSAPQWFVLHKPAGTMTTARDPQGRPTVFELLPQVPGLTYVGRLDLLTEGVLLMTTDGAAAHRLTHPSFGIEREYAATVRGDAEGAVAAMRRGVELDDGLARVARATSESLGRGRHVLTLVLAEGRTREVRRLALAVGLEVERLVRIRYGPVELGSLAAGTWRSLREAEAVALGVAVVATGGTRRPPRGK